MALITRVSRLFRADMHAVIDRMEEPDLLLKQAVRDMEEELARDEQRAKARQLEQAQLVARAAELERSLAEIEQELDLCFAAGEEALARAVVKRKLELQRLAAAIARRRRTTEHALSELGTRLDENRTRLESMRQKAEILGEGAAAGRAEEGWNTTELAVRADEVDVAFLREQQRRSRS